MSDKPFEVPIYSRRRWPYSSEISFLILPVYLQSKMRRSSIPKLKIFVIICLYYHRIRYTRLVAFQCNLATVFIRREYFLWRRNRFERRCAPGSWRVIILVILIGWRENVHGYLLSCLQIFHQTEWFSTLNIFSPDRWFRYP